MDKVCEISLLLDFYGQLLTDRQYEILDLHYNNDYSLGEIAAQLNISRQGVFDNEKRGKASLYEYEGKLGLVKKFTGQKQKAQAMLAEIKNLKTELLDEENKVIVKKIEDGINDIINEI